MPTHNEAEAEVIDGVNYEAGAEAGAEQDPQPEAATGAPAARKKGEVVFEDGSGKIWFNEVVSKQAGREGQVFGKYEFVGVDEKRISLWSKVAGLELSAEQAHALISGLEVPVKREGKSKPDPLTGEEKPNYYWQIFAPLPLVAETIAATDKKPERTVYKLPVAVAMANITEHATGELNCSSFSINGLNIEGVEDRNAPKISVYRFEGPRGNQTKILVADAIQARDAAFRNEAFALKSATYTLPMKGIEPAIKGTGMRLVFDRAQFNSNAPTVARTQRI